MKVRGKREGKGGHAQEGRRPVVVRVLVRGRRLAVARLRLPRHLLVGLGIKQRRWAVVVLLLIVVVAAAAARAAVARRGGAAVARAARGASLARLLRGGRLRARVFHRHSLRTRSCTTSARGVRTKRVAWECAEKRERAFGVTTFASSSATDSSKSMVLAVPRSEAAASQSPARRRYACKGLVFCVRPDFGLFPVPTQSTHPAGGARTPAPGTPWPSPG